MKIIPLEPSLGQVWDHVALHSDDASVFHVYDWQALTEANWDIESKSFLVEYEGRVAGIFPLQLNRRSKSLKSTYLGLGGPALLADLQEGVRQKLMKAMHEQACAIAQESQSPFLEVLLSSLSESSLANRWQTNPLVHYMYEDISSHTRIVDLQQPLEEIYGCFSHEAKRMIKKATAAGYTVEQVCSLSDIDILYEVHVENRRRTGAQAHPKNFFVGFYQDFCQKGLAAMFQAKTPQGEPIAFEVTSLFKKGAGYWMGSCRSRHLHGGVNYLLQHHSMRWAKSQGARWFENGEVFPNVPEGKLFGLTVFKNKFGGQLHRLFKGKATFKHPCRWERLYSAVSGLWGKHGPDG